MATTQITPSISRTIRRVCLLNPQGFVSYPPQLGKTDTGGQTLYVLELAKALGKKNIKVDIITRHFDSLPTEEKIFDNTRIIRVPCGDNNFVQKEKLYNLMPEMISNFNDYLAKKQKSYDLIHSHYWDGGYAGIILKKLLNIPHIHTPHTLGKQKKLQMSAENTPLQKLEPIYRYHLRTTIEQKIINKADSIILLCETTRIKMLEQYIVEDFEKLQVVYPGINTQSFTTTKKAIDKRLKLEPNSILTISRMVPAKGLDLVIEALALLKNKINFHYYMASGGDEESLCQEEKETKEQIRQLIDKYHLTERVTMLGNIPHESVLPAYYRNADLFILASRYEPFGLTTMEAMACGTAPIVSSNAGSREIVVDGLNGFLIDTSDHHLLANTIEKAMTDKPLREKISENAAFTIKEHYSWENIAEKILAVYKKVL